MKRMLENLASAKPVSVPTTPRDLPDNPSLGPLSIMAPLSRQYMLLHLDFGPGRLYHALNH